MSARISHYELLDRFAVGGVAEIFRARDVRSGDLVVIKRIRPDISFDPDQHAGFIRELQLALLCTHENLIRGFEKGSQNGSDYGVLEYVDGIDLAAVLAREKKLPPALAVYVVTEVLAGLDFAFRLKDATGRQLGLVHRDLAPKNVILRYDGRVCVGDFGSSLATKQEPRGDAIVGTLGYLSPEQARMGTLDQRSDIFAAGLVLYEMLVGQPAFDVAGKRDAAVFKLHQRGVIKAVPRSVPEELRLVVEIATAPDPDDRYRTARDMRTGLLRTDFSPPPSARADLAALLRKRFDDRWRKTRLPP